MMYDVCLWNSSLGDLTFDVNDDHVFELNCKPRAHTCVIIIILIIFFNNKIINAQFVEQYQYIVLKSNTGYTVVQRDF